MIHKEKTTEELKKFGYVMGLVISLFVAVLAWRGRTSALYLVMLAVAFILSAIVRPQILAPVERVWMAIGEKIGFVMTYVIMTLMFVLVITPLGVALRLFGKDLLKTKLDPTATSYWVPVEKDGPASRHFLPY